MRNSKPVLAALVAASGLAGVATAAGVSHADRTFIEMAAQAGRMEVEASQLAQTKASSAEVKSFASTMIDDHGKAGTELDQLAASKGVKVPSEPSIAQRAKLKLLGLSSGASFDKHYASEIGVSAHKDAVALFEQEASAGSDPEVKAYAAKTLPTLKHHLEMATSLQLATVAKN